MSINFIAKRLPTRSTGETIDVTVDLLCRPATSANAHKSNHPLGAGLAAIFIRSATDLTDATPMMMMQAVDDAALVRT